jgi:hypothetical protein
LFPSPAGRGVRGEGFTRVQNPPASPKGEGEDTYSKLVAVAMT